MKQERKIVNQGFERIKHIDENGVEFWYARELMPILEYNKWENFEKVINKDNVSDELKNYLVGFKMIYKNLCDILKKYGVEEINRVGQVFDPNLEQALLVDNDPSKEDDIVLEVLLKGYKLKDRVIRPASVKINQL